MGFRTVVVSSRCKCSYKNGYMVLQNTDIKMVHLSEIDSVIFETVAVSISGVLLSELCKKKVRIIFCDERHLPYSHLGQLCEDLFNNLKKEDDGKKKQKIMFGQISYMTKYSNNQTLLELQEKK